jgi:hypothetical protein
MKILHISFHRGCQNDIQYVCDKLGLSLEFMEFDDGITKTNARYNVGHKRANDCWNKYSDYFNSFDIIITSDTAPISRVFLQNNFQKKLIIWVCNRFDYADQASNDCGFPDNEYYELIKSAKNRPNVIIAGYTPFENYYAKNIRNVDIGELIIKPLGGISNVYNNFTESDVSNKSEKFFVPPYHNDTIMMNLAEKLTNLSIPNHNGRYNGPLDLAKFKGVIHIPYAWSNLALFEGLSLGIVYFIPDKNFLIQIKKHKNFFWSPPYREEVLELSEWYNPELSDVLVYFNSWEDLKFKIKNLNYQEQKDKLKNFIQAHQEKYFNIWKNIITG